MKSTLCLLAALFLLVSVGAVRAVAQAGELGKDFTYKKSDTTVDILKDDKVVATYVYRNAAKPYIYPVTSPAGVEVTRNYPMKTVAGEPTDHPHQRSMWIGFGDVNGVDFWGETPKSGKIVQQSIAFDPISPGPYWSIHTNNDWFTANGKKLASDERHVAFYSCKQGTVIVTGVSIIASVSQLQFNDSKEGFFGMRLAPSLTLKDGKGHILNSEGDKDDKAWGKRARWVDYTGEVDGKTVGVTMFDSPRNYGYPTYWHARDYGLLAANPFGGKAFTGDAKNETHLKLPYTQSLFFVYIVLIHDGKLDAKTLDALADDLAGRKPKPVTETDSDKKTKETGSKMTPLEAPRINPSVEPAPPSSAPAEGKPVGGKLPAAVNPAASDPSAD